MGLKEDLARIERKLENAIDSAMQTEVTQRTKEVLADSIEKNVYDKYKPSEYERRGAYGGGLQDPEVMVDYYSAEEKLLQLSDVSVDDDSGRLVAPIVERGEGYEWYGSRIYRKQPFPRPFHKPAEEKMGNGEFEFALRDGLLRQGFDVK